MCGYLNNSKLTKIVESLGLSTPCVCDDISEGREYAEMAGERLPKQRPQDEEHPDHNTEEQLGARFPHQLKR